MSGRNLKLPKHSELDSFFYKNDTHIEKSHLELGILIESLLAERDTWRNVADMAIGYGPRQCEHDDANCSAHPNCQWCRVICAYENAVTEYGIPE